MRGHDDFGTIVLPKESYATVRGRGGCVGVALPSLSKLSGILSGIEYLSGIESCLLTNLGGART